MCNLLYAANPNEEAHLAHKFVFNINAPWDTPSRTALGIVRRNLADKGEPAKIVWATGRKTSSRCFDTVEGAMAYLGFTDVHRRAAKAAKSARHKAFFAFSRAEPWDCWANDPAGYDDYEARRNAAVLKAAKEAWQAVMDPHNAAIEARLAAK